jgi:sodium/bile acid cotransporter 7
MKFFLRLDPMVRLVLGTILFASLLPVKGHAREVAQYVSNAAVFTLFLLNGLRLSRSEVLAGLGNHRLLIPLVLWVFGAMTAVGWLLWEAGGWVLPGTLALGFLYLGTMPSTVQSATTYSSLAGGNVASSVVAAALINILAIFITAPLFSLLAGGGEVGVSGASMLKVFIILLLPFVIGQFLQRWTRHWVLDHRRIMSVVDRSSIAIAVYVAFSGAVEQGIWNRVGLIEWVGLTIGCIAMLVVGYGGPWLLGRVLGLSRGDRIAMLFAGAQKSVAMGAPMATVLFPPAIAGTVLLPLLTYHLAQMIVAAPIATRLRAA